MAVASFSSVSFHDAFAKFLTGEVPEAKMAPAPTEAPPPNALPGKKAYVPPYTPKNVNRPNTAAPRPSPAKVTPSRSRPSTSSTPSSSAAVNRSHPAPTPSGSASATPATPTTHHTSSSSATSPNFKHIKRPKMREMSGIEKLEVEMAVLPKRESSRRRAKETAKRSTQAFVAEDEDEAPDIEFEDSDEDATWTPFKGKEAAEVKEDDDDDYLEGEVREGMPANIANTSKSGFKKLKASPSSELPEPTQLVPDGHEFSIGDFMVLKSDADRESAPIWRLDSRTLLQRYNPIPGNHGSQTIHRSASLFSGYSNVNRDNYLSISVKFIAHSKDQVTVNVLKKGWCAGMDSAMDPSLRKRSMAETSQFQEPFEVYIQALISQCLDGNFLQEVFNDQDEYFVSNIEKVDSVTLLRKDKVMAGISWSVKFQRAVDTWPCLNDLGASAAQDVECGACDTDKASTMIQMFGQPYDSTALKTRPPSEDAVMNRNFSVCAKCSRLGQLYHKLQHQKHRMFAMATEVVEDRKKNARNSDTTKILNELLANEVWLEQQFRKMQDLWADADTFVR